MTKQQTWRCALCPEPDRWRAAPEGCTAEQAWEAHLRDTHRGEVGQP